MRALISTAAVTGLAFALVATTANATPTVQFGQGAKKPADCTVSGLNLDCTAAAGTVLNFSVIVVIGVDGTAGASFSAAWDAGLQNALGSAGASQGTQTFITVDAGPPAVTVGYTPGTSAPGVSNSTGASAGSAASWNFIANTPASATNIQTAGFSWRAGTLSVTVDSTAGTRITLGHFASGVDVFLAASGTQLAPNFGYADINAAPEPGITLLMGLGLLGLTLAGRSSRK